MSLLTLLTSLLNIDMPNYTCYDLLVFCLIISKKINETFINIKHVKYTKFPEEEIDL